MRQELVDAEAEDVVAGGLELLLQLVDGGFRLVRLEQLLDVPLDVGLLVRTAMVFFAAVFF